MKSFLFLLLSGLSSFRYHSQRFRVDFVHKTTVCVLVNAVFGPNGALVRKKSTKKNGEDPKSDIQKVHEEFLKTLEDYDKRIRPGLGAPLPVTVNMLVQSRGSSFYLD